MFRRVVAHVRRQPVAFVALFFALTGSAFAGSKYLTARDPITQGDLAGSTYGNPLIANGVITTSKFANDAVAPVAASLQFTTASGTAGPTLNQAGTYFVVVKAFMTNTGTTDNPQVGYCVIGANAPRPGLPVDSFAGAFDQQPGTAAPRFSFSGMLVVNSSSDTPASIHLACTDDAGNAVTPVLPLWWVSKAS